MMSSANSANQSHLTLDSEQQMVDFGGRLATAIGQLNAPLLILLNGHLGAGKTTLSRGILQGLGHLGAVKSPTYTLVEPYDLGIGKVFHFDLYRLMDAQELEHIGFTDYLSEAKLCMIEWPENGDSYIPQPDIEISISLFKSGRRVVLNAQSERGEQCLIQLKL